MFTRDLTFLLPACTRADGAWPNHVERERHSRSAMYREQTMSIIPSALSTLAVALTLAMPVTAESPAVISLAKDESDAAAVIAKFKEKDSGLS